MALNLVDQHGGSTTRGTKFSTRFFHPNLDEKVIAFHSFPIFIISGTSAPSS
jgi:hypothetical protein